jgi:hypothetical protein
MSRIFTRIISILPIVEVWGEATLSESLFGKYYGKE